MHRVVRAVLAIAAADDRPAVAEDIVGSAEARRVEQEGAGGARKRDLGIEEVPRHARIQAYGGRSVVVGGGIELGQAVRRRIGLAVVIEANAVLHRQTAGHFPVILGIEGENIVGDLKRLRRFCLFGIARLANAHQRVGVHVAGDERRPTAVSQVAPLPPVVLGIVDELPIDAHLCGVRADDLGQILPGGRDLLVAGEGELIADIA